MLGLTWRPRAQVQLFHFLNYISQRDENAAARLLATINEAVDFARQFPGAYRQGRRRGTREIVAHPNYIVVYRVTSNEVDVVSVLHARQKYP